MVEGWQEIKDRERVTWVLNVVCRNESARRICTLAILMAHAVSAVYAMLCKNVHSVTSSVT